MELRWRNKADGEIGVAYVTDNDAKILQCVGYYHCIEEDFNDAKDEAYIEVWKPNK